MTTDAARIRVDTRYEIDLMPITSSASISSLIRMAPSSAVAPAPTVAASAWPVTIGGDDTHVGQGREESREGLNADVAQRGEPLDRDE